MALEWEPQNHIRPAIVPSSIFPLFQGSRVNQSAPFAAYPNFLNGFCQQGALKKASQSAFVKKIGMP
jgi:hypothetical protein